MQLFLVSCATSNYKLQKSLPSLVILQDKNGSKDETYVSALIYSKSYFNSHRPYFRRLISKYCITIS